MKIHIRKLAEFIRLHKRTLAVLTITILITILLHTLVSIWLSRRGNLHFPSIGTIHVLNVEVYGGDIQKCNGEKCLDWGIVYPGKSLNRTFYAKSKSNAEATLIIKIVNWTLYKSETPDSDEVVLTNCTLYYESENNRVIYGPSESIEYFTLYAPENRTMLKPGETIKVTLYLDAADSIDFIDFVIENDIKSFQFDIYVFMSEPT